MSLFKILMYETNLFLQLIFLSPKYHNDKHLDCGTKSIIDLH